MVLDTTPCGSLDPDLLRWPLRRPNRNSQLEPRRHADAVPPDDEPRPGAGVRAPAVALLPPFALSAAVAVVLARPGVRDGGWELVASSRAGSRSPSVRLEPATAAHRPSKAGLAINPWASPCSGFGELRPGPWAWWVGCSAHGMRLAKPGWAWPGPPAAIRRFSGGCRRSIHELLWGCLLLQLPGVETNRPWRCWPSPSTLCLPTWLAPGLE